MRQQREHDSIANTVINSHAQRSTRATQLNESNSSPSIPQPPVMQLTRRWLTISLIAVTLIPVTLAATVWIAIPESPEPELAVEVVLEPVPWPPEGSDVRLMPGVRIHNTSHEPWSNVSMAINKQFYFYCPEPIAGESDFRVPLAFFKTSGNQPYRPTIVPLKMLTVYAQLPSGKRAIRDVKYPVKDNGK